MTTDYRLETTAKKGFTLIELLVSISIIAIISAIGFVTYSSAQISARDSKRKQDLKALQTSVTLYYQQNRKYPGYSGTWYKSTDATAPWIHDINYNYINLMPVDPKNNGTGATPANSNYQYFYQGCGPNDTFGFNTTGFVLIAFLENGNDPDRNAVKNYTYCNGTVTNVAWTNAYVVGN